MKYDWKWGSPLLISISGYQCEHCDFFTKWRKTLRDHVRRKHTANPPRYSCDSCDFSTLCKTSLRNHRKRIHEQLRFQCSQCPSSYGNATGRYAMFSKNRDVSFLWENNNLYYMPIVTATYARKICIPVSENSTLILFYCLCELFVCMFVCLYFSSKMWTKIN